LTVDGLRAIGLALAASGALLVTGCGGGSDEREQVSQFVKDANAIQERSGPAFDRANRTYVSFSKGALSTASAKTQLAAAEQAMRRTRDDIAALDAPSDAKELQRRLVALYDADAALAHESTLLATFVPASATAMKPLGAIGRRLTRGLKSANTAPQQMAALRAYAASVGKVIKRLQPLKPPPLLLERHHGQVEHLTQVRALALRLVKALRRQDSRAVARLLLRFQKLNSESISAPLPPGALAAYNRRYLRVRRALQAVERERSRVERTLR
jgi:hypothetical protein